MISLVLAGVQLCLEFIESTNEQYKLGFDNIIDISTFTLIIIYVIVFGLTH